MKTKYKYFHFELAPENFRGEGGIRKRKTLIWWCLTNPDSKIYLGTIKWFSRWRQYCFFPAEETPTVFSQSCLEDVNDFLKQLKEARKNENKKG